MKIYKKKEFQKEYLKQIKCKTQIMRIFNNNF